MYSTKKPIIIYIAELRLLRKLSFAKKPKSSIIYLKKFYISISIMSILRTKLLSKIRPSPNTIYNRNGLLYLTRPPLSCSLLKSHGFNHKITIIMDSTPCLPVPKTSPLFTLTLSFIMIKNGQTYF